MPYIMTLELDEDDYRIIQAEIACRQRRSREAFPGEPTLLPEGESSLAGAILAEVIRDLDEYRDRHDANRKPPTQG
ncbi:hypothetical protein [Tautonia marina]|uniref:hypothetical protein n=1 Tax=Tautonia marina TaxID=2653855 RepID=UPI001260850E|nr:hypothetical protein [Tautonia marina]